MVDDKMDRRRKHDKTKHKSKKGNLINDSSSDYEPDDHDNVDLGQVNVQVCTPAKHDEQPETNLVNKIKSPGQMIIKSPSDTTLYSPGLRKANQDDVALIEKIS